MLFLHGLKTGTEINPIKLDTSTLSIKQRRNPNIKGRSLLIPLGLDGVISAYAKALGIPYTSAVADLVRKGLKNTFPNDLETLTPEKVQSVLSSLTKKQLSAPSNAELDLRRLRRKAAVKKLLGLAHPLASPSSSKKEGVPKPLLGFTQLEAQQALGRNQVGCYPILRGMIQEGLIEKIGLGAAAKYFLKKTLPARNTKEDLASIQPSPLVRAKKKPQPVFEYPDPTPPSPSKGKTRSEENP